MATDGDPAALRRLRRADLHRLTKPFLIDTQTITSGRAVALARSGEGTLPYLDGDVFSGGITLAPKAAAPYSGTRWVIQQGPDGTWGFLNQGQPDKMLVASAGFVALGRPLAGSAMARFATTRWLLYRDLICFRLRPVMAVSGWLGVRDTALILSDPGDVPGRWMYWDVVPLQDDRFSPRE